MIINGVDISAFDLTLTQAPPVTKPQKRVRLIPIPGRSGFVTQWSGDYEPYTKETEFLYTGEDVNEALDFLRSASLVIFPNDDSYVYEVNSNEIIDAVRQPSGVYLVTAPYLTQPLKRLVEEPVLDGEITYTVTNIGNEPALPKIIVTGAGTKTLTIGSDEITIAFAVGGETITIDSLNGQIYDSDGASAWSKVTGSLPTIPASESDITISTTGTELTIYPNWRWT